MRDDAGPPAVPPHPLRWNLIMCACALGATTLASVVLTAALREKWVMPPLVFAGPFASVLIYWWHWRRLLFRPEVRLPPGDARRQTIVATAALILVAGVFVELVLGWIIVLSTRNEHVQPCLCANQAGLIVWLNLAAGALVLPILIAGVLFGMAHAVYELAYVLRR